MIIYTKKGKKKKKKKINNSDQSFELNIFKDGVYTKVKAHRRGGIIYIGKEPYRAFAKVKSVRDTRLDPALSQGEILIGNWFKERNIAFDREKSFRKLINPATGMRLRMDFFVVHNKRKYCIEFDGLQHFVDSPKFHEQKGDSLEKQQARDEIKNQYCLDSNIKMVRIRYNQINLIDKILSEHFG